MLRHVRNVYASSNEHIRVVRGSGPSDGGGCGGCLMIIAGLWILDAIFESLSENWIVLLMLTLFALFACVLLLWFCEQFGFYPKDSFFATHPLKKIYIALIFIVCLFFAKEIPPLAENWIRELFTSNWTEQSGMLWWKTETEKSRFNAEGAKTMSTAIYLASFACIYLGLRSLCIAASLCRARKN